MHTSCWYRPVPTSAPHFVSDLRQYACGATMQLVSTHQALAEVLPTLLRAALSLLARMRFTRLGSSSISSLSLLPLQPPRRPPARLPPRRLGPKPSLSLSLSQSL
jgi:hypothetical protein